MSYTTFKIGKVATTQTLTFSVPVTNTGSRAGAETIQLYIHDKKSSLERPYKELKAFQKVSLKPGESRDVTLTIDRRALSFWDEESGDWKAEPGDFVALVGNASDNLPCQVQFALK